MFFPAPDSHIGDPSASEQGRDFGTDPGVLLLQMGGPERLEDVEPYLRALFADGEMIRLPLGVLYRRLLARIVAARRAGRIRERYRAIGGRSPLVEITRRQASALARELGRPVACGMRYTRPNTAEAVAELRAMKVRNLVALPLYPQYSRCTTGSALIQLERCARDLAVTVVKDHHDDAGYIEAVSEKLRGYLSDWPADGRSRVLFAAHSIPLSYVRRGDPYVEQTRRTARLVAEASGLGEQDWRLAFSSRLGPVRWQGPSLEEMTAQLQSEQVRRLVVVPLSFVAENLETLWDLDLVFHRRCARAGIADFRRVPAVGDSERYVAALARLVRNASRAQVMRHG